MKVLQEEKFHIWYFHRYNKISKYSMIVYQPTGSELWQWMNKWSFLPKSFTVWKSLPGLDVSKTRIQFLKPAYSWVPSVVNDMECGETNSSYKTQKKYNIKQKAYY